MCYYTQYKYKSAHSVRMFIARFMNMCEIIFSAEGQACFKTGRITEEQIANVRILNEKYKNHHIKAGLYRIWCGLNRLGDSGLHTLVDTSAFVNPAGQLLLTRRGKIRMDGVGIVFEFYIALL